MQGRGEIEAGIRENGGIVPRILGKKRGAVWGFKAVSGVVPRALAESCFSAEGATVISG